VTRDLRRQLGLVAVMAVVAGDMMGSGIFYTPQELAPIALTTWHIYLFWGLCGTITLCGILTVGQLGAGMPRSGADYHIIREGFGGMAGFVKLWQNVWVSGPGSVAAVAILFGKFCSDLMVGSVALSPVGWGILAIVTFTVINLFGVEWGGRTQIILTAIKIVALLSLVVGSLLLVEATPAKTVETATAAGDGIWGLFRLIGLGIGAVLFTYDGWVDIMHAAGEVKNPRKNLPLGLTLGLGLIIVIYLLTNYAYLRIVPLEEMATNESLAAVVVAEKTFGVAGGKFIILLMMFSIFGALGGLVMTFPRLLFAAGTQYKQKGQKGILNGLFRLLSKVTPKTQVPAGAIWVSCFTSIVALFFFQSFSRIVNFFVVPNHLFNILLVAAVFRFVRRSGGEKYKSFGYPLVPIIYIVTIAGFLISALIYRPTDTLIGVALTATGIPVYLWLKRRSG
tara:strand:- start:8963 stop:10315 length:1353 start_codon:yes stop_codon:yes gene_type:complete